MSGHTLILSDTHLGRSRGAARSAHALRPLWQDAERLVINGDVAEIHHPGHMARAARETLALFDLCEEDGVELTLLSGNHDPYLTDHRHMRLAEGRVFVTHGDVLHPAVAPWSPSAGRVQEAHDAAVATLSIGEREHLEQRLSVTQFAAHAQWSDLEAEAKQSTVMGMLIRPLAIWKVFQYWKIAPGLAAEFVKTHAPDARFILVGHTHHPGVWEIDGRVVINTGSYGFPGRPRAVMLDDSTLSVWPIRLRRGLYELGSRPLAMYPLDIPESQSLSEYPLQDAAPSAVKARPGRSRPRAAVI